MGIGNAIIGALRVNLGLDSAAFTAGLKLAQGELGQFSRVAKVGLIGLASAAVGVGSALAVATKASINHSDALSKAAQKAGVTTEALSRLAYAASYSDVTMEDMTGSLGKLSKVMADSTQQATGPAALAFRALGIEVKDSSGTLRNAGDVFSDIADRFSQLENGSTKTAIAMTLFGKSGANLIPFLNGGATDIKRLSDEADRLGITLSTRTGKAAEHFNDTLALVGKIMAGVVNRIAEAALPALQRLADTLADPAVADAAAFIGTNLVEAINLVANAFENAWNWANQFVDLLKKVPALGFNVGVKIGGVQIGPGQTPANSSGSPDDRNSGGTPITIHGGASSSPMDLGIFTGGGLKKVQDSIDPFAARFEELAPVLEKLHDPFQQMKDDLTDLETMFKAGRITAQQYGDSVTRTNLNAIGSFADMAAGVSGALASLFKDNKAFAVSNAILQGLSGVAYALGSSAPPWNFINAAAVGIEAAANVASILSTNQNSTSIPGGGTGGAAAAAAAPAAQQGINFTIRGTGMVGVEDIVNQITQQAKDGGFSDFVNVIRSPA